MPIEIKDLSHIYHENTPMEKIALNNINLEINDGEMIALIGETGSGKSTTLACLIDKINEERKQYEDVYKQDLTRLREMKIKRANPADIAKLEKDLKKNQKMLYA